MAQRLANGRRFGRGTVVLVGMIDRLHDKFCSRSRGIRIEKAIPIYHRLSLSAGSVSRCCRLTHGATVRHRIQNTLGVSSTTEYHPVRKYRRESAGRWCRWCRWCRLCRCAIRGAISIIPSRGRSRIAIASRSESMSRRRCKPQQRLTARMQLNNVKYRIITTIHAITRPTGCGTLPGANTGVISLGGS